MEGATILAQGVKKCGGLTSLNVAWNCIGLKARARCGCLVNNTTLTALNLGRNELCAINSFGQGQYNTDGIERSPTRSREGIHSWMSRQLPHGCHRTQARLLEHEWN